MDYENETSMVDDGCTSIPSSVLLLVRIAEHRGQTRNFLNSLAVMLWMQFSFCQGDASS